MRFVTLAVLILMALPVHATDFWPLQDNVTYTYATHAGGRIEALFSSQGVRFESADCVESMGLESNDDGDILFGRWMQMCPGFIDPSWWRLDDPFLFLDLPLEVGKTWYSTRGGFSGYDIPPTILLGTVLRTETISVPAGAFDVTVVDLDYIFDSGPLDGLWYLHETLGPVAFPGGWQLVDVQGLIPTTDTTWSSLKAQYR